MPCMSSPRETDNESYPWATSTPEASPRYSKNCWGEAPDVPVKPMLSLELLRMVCEPCFEQICYIAEQAPVEATVCYELLRSMCEPSFEQVIIVLQQMSMASDELLRAVCEPFFEQMITALQQTMQQHSLQEHLTTQCQSMPMISQATTDMYFQPVFCSTTDEAQLVLHCLGFDEASTEADFSQSSSLFSYPSSEGEGVDANASKSEDSESTGNVDRNIMVCKHWKSKGWCRLESNCKFLHLEHKCGISAPKAFSGQRTHGASDLVSAINAEGASSEMSAAQHRKRGHQIHQEAMRLRL